jgi:cytochrome c-type biogenesis protein CcmH
MRGPYPGPLPLVRPALVGAAAVGALVLGVAALFWSATRSPPPAPPGEPRRAAQIVGRVELPATGLAAPPAQATLVVYAYALDGPRLPLAVLHQHTGSAAFPMDFKLDDTLAPNPAFRLSQAVQLVVGARLGAGEGVAAQPGDWLAAPQTVPLGTHGVKLVLRPPAAASAVPPR